MIVLIANLGSTSFKCKLFDCRQEGGGRVFDPVATGAVERIGLGNSGWTITHDGKDASGVADLADHGAAIDLVLKQFDRVGATQGGEIGAVGFKAVHGGPISGAVRVDDTVMDALEKFSDVAPAHNPPYMAAMKAMRKVLPGVPQVAAFETAFHSTIPLARRVYGTPYQWVEQGILRYGFHGASNRYLAQRMAQIAPAARKLVTLHLGGSSSVGAINDGKSVAHSMGMSAQTGLFHANRVGDFDAFAMMKLIASGMSVDQIFDDLSKKGGMLGLSGVSSDTREVKQAADKGNQQAQLALDAFVESCRHYLGAYAVALGGIDAVVFTAGIGQNAPWLRSAICEGLGFLGLELDPDRNAATTGNTEAMISTENSTTKVWVVPTNEELVVAQQTVDVLESGMADASAATP
jgi:acetate kinase